MAPEDLLLAARDVMRDRGMCRTVFEANDGRVCLFAALHIAPWGGSRLPAYEHLRQECASRFGALVGVMSANDSHIVDLDDACDVLEAAAKRAASEAGGAP